MADATPVLMIGLDSAEVTLVDRLCAEERLTETDKPTLRFEEDPADIRLRVDANGRNRPDPRVVHAALQAPASGANHTVRPHAAPKRAPLMGVCARCPG